MSTTTFVVGDRVKCVDDGGAGIYAGLRGQFGTVKTVPAGTKLPTMDVEFDDGRRECMFARRFEKVEKAPATAPAAPRLFKKGDRVRVVKRNFDSLIEAAIGSVLTVSQDAYWVGGSVYVRLVEESGDRAADQFELVTEAASTVEYVRTPDGVVAPVDEVTAGGAKKVAGVYYDPARLTPAEAPKPLPDVPADADTMLRMVDVFLARGDSQSCYLQSVLAALRGPDEDKNNKAATTVPIRRAALPECAKKADGTAKDRWAGSSHTANMSFDAQPFDAKMVGGHFGSHIQSAVEALRAMGREVK